MKQILTSSIALLLGVSSLAMAGNEPAQVGPRPLYLVNDMEDGELKNKLQSCSAGPFHRTDFSIGHRGAAMQFLSTPRSLTSRQSRWVQACWSVT